MRRLNLSDWISVGSSALTFAFCISSALLGECKGYEFNTGMFCGAFCLLPFFLHQAKVMTLPAVFVLAIELAVGLHSFGVLFFGYDILSFYDNITHTLSSVVVALCVFFTLMCYHVINGKVDFTGLCLALAISLIMLGFSAYWEVFEYIVDLTTGTAMQYSAFDTIRDMICNTAGCVIVSIAAGIYTRRRDPKDIVDSFELHPRLQKFINSPFDDSRN